MLCWFLPYINMNWPQAYTCPFPSEPPSHPHPTPLSGLRVLVWAPCIIPQIPTGCEFYMCSSLHWSHILLPPLCPQVCSICVSVAALQIDSSGPSFQIPLNQCLVTQSHLTLCNTMHCSPPGPLVHGDSPGQNTGVVCHALLQGVFPTEGLNPGLLHCRQILYQLSYQGSLIYVLIYCICLFLSHLLHSIIGSRFIHLIRTDPKAFLFMAE